MANLRSKLEVLRKLTGGATADPFDPMRTRPGGDFWIYRKYLDTLPVPFDAQLLPEWRKPGYSKPQPRAKWHGPVPAKPAGWDEYEAAGDRKIQAFSASYPWETEREEPDEETDTGPLVILDKPPEPPAPTEPDTPHAPPGKLDLFRENDVEVSAEFKEIFAPKAD